MSSSNCSAFPARPLRRHHQAAHLSLTPTLWTTRCTRSPTGLLFPFRSKLASWAVISVSHPHVTLTPFGMGRSESLYQFLGVICLHLMSDWFIIQFSSVAHSCPTLCDPMNRSTPGLPFHHQLPEFTQTHVHRVGDAIQPSYPLSSPSPPAPNPSQIRVFSNESTLPMRWPKYWSFSFSIIPPKEIPGLISFRMDWLDLLAVWGTLKSLLQHHSSKASILQHSALLLY